MATKRSLSLLATILSRIKMIESKKSFPATFGSSSLTKTWFSMSSSINSLASTEDISSFTSFDTS